LPACGFQLRGQAQLPFDSLYIAGQENSALIVELRRNVQAGTTTAISRDAASAQAVLKLSGEQRERDILSVNAAGKVRELQLRYRVTVRVFNGKGDDYLAPTDFVLTRDYTFDDARVLAKESEEALLFQDMQTDLVQQILRRLSTLAARPAPAAGG
jgi:LPS-assembly lipoprotein